MAVHRSINCGHYVALSCRTDLKLRAASCLHLHSPVFVMRSHEARVLNTSQYLCSVLLVFLVIHTVSKLFIVTLKLSTQ